MSGAAPPAGWPAFDWLEALEPSPADLADALAVHAAPAGAVLFDERDPCKGFPVVFEGEIRVARSSEDGRSLELYRVVPGEICLVSSACLFGGTAMTARGQATRDTRFALVPPDVFMAWMRAPAFRTHVLGQFADRMADLTATVDALAFRRLDERLAEALLGQGPDLRVTHQELADRLGTVREMISRLLRRFDQAGWIEVGREHIRILDSAALRAHAQRRD